MSMTVFTSCKDDEGDGPTGPTELEQKTEQLEGTWNVTSVTRPGVTGNVLEDGQNVTLTFTEAGGYTATNADVMPGETPAFPSGSNWAFPDENTFNRIIITPGDINFNVTTLNATTLNFTYTTQDAKSDGQDVTVTVNATKQ